MLEGLFDRFSPCGGVCGHGQCFQIGGNDLLSRTRELIENLVPVDWMCLILGPRDIIPCLPYNRSPLAAALKT